METYLYYSYLKFRHEKHKPLEVLLKNVPWWMWALFTFSVIGYGIGLATFATARGELWRKLVMLSALGCLGLLCIGIEHIQINDSKKRLENYWLYIHNVKGFLSENGIYTGEDIALVKQRVESRLNDAKKELQTMKNNDEKWMQTFIFPIVLAIITTFLSQQDDVIKVISDVTTIVIIFGVIILSMTCLLCILRSIRNWEITNLSWFVEDLQGVLDIDHFKINVAKE